MTFNKFEAPNEDQKWIESLSKLSISKPSASVKRNIFSSEVSVSETSRRKFEPSWGLTAAVLLLGIFLTADRKFSEPPKSIHYKGAAFIFDGHGSPHSLAELRKEWMNEQCES